MDLSSQGILQKKQPSCRGLSYIKSRWIYILPQPVLGQLGEHTCSIFAAFLLFLLFNFPFSAANEPNDKAPARANKNIFFIDFNLSEVIKNFYQELNAIRRL